MLLVARMWFSKMNLVTCHLFLRDVDFTIDLSFSLLAFVCRGEKYTSLKVYKYGPTSCAWMVKLQEVVENLASLLLCLQAVEIYPKIK